MLRLFFILHSSRNFYILNWRSCLPTGFKVVNLKTINEKCGNRNLQSQKLPHHFWLGWLCSLFLYRAVHGSTIQSFVHHVAFFLNQRRPVWRSQQSYTVFRSCRNFKVRQSIRTSDWRSEFRSSQVVLLPLFQNIKYGLIIIVIAVVNPRSETDWMIYCQHTDAAADTGLCTLHTRRNDCVLYSNMPTSR